MGNFKTQGNLADFVRRLSLYAFGGFGQALVPNPEQAGLREKLIKIGAKIVPTCRDSRYITFQMAEVALPGDLFAAILSCIRQLRL